MCFILLLLVDFDPGCAYLDIHVHLCNLVDVFDVMRNILHYWVVKSCLVKVKKNSFCCVVHFARGLNNDYFNFAQIMKFVMLSLV